jgi:Nucleotidyl transferase AbiEii toxin, Type IV TA system
VPLPDQIRDILPADTAMVWEMLAPAIPTAAYLAGGTAVAVHLGHRVSHDLDFFYHHNAIDLDELARAIDPAREESQPTVRRRCAAAPRPDRPEPPRPQRIPRSTDRHRRTLPLLHQQIPRITANTKHVRRKR